jgi:hypothetical protein
MWWDIVINRRGCAYEGGRIVAVRGERNTLIKRSKTSSVSRAAAEYY